MLARIESIRGRNGADVCIVHREAGSGEGASLALAVGLEGPHPPVPSTQVPRPQIVPRCWREGAADCQAPTSIWVVGAPLSLFPGAPTSASLPTIYRLVTWCRLQMVAATGMSHHTSESLSLDPQGAHRRSSSRLQLSRH